MKQVKQKVKHEFPTEVIKRDSIVVQYLDYIKSIIQNDTISDEDWIYIRDIVKIPYPEYENAHRKKRYKEIDKVHETQRINALRKVINYEDEHLRNYLVLAHLMYLIQETK